MLRSLPNKKKKIFEFQQQILVPKNTPRRYMTSVKFGQNDSIETFKTKEQRNCYLARLQDLEELLHWSKKPPAGNRFNKYK